MQRWTKWFRDEQAQRGWDNAETAQAIGISVRLLGLYRSGTIPKAPDKLKLIADAFGSTGPLPPRGRREQMRDYDERLQLLEERVSALEDRLPPRKRPSASTSPGAGKTDADLNAAAAAAREERLKRRR